MKLTKQKKWNEEAALNNNLQAEDIQYAKELSNDLPFTEELSDGGERNEVIERQIKGK